jgi:hypothetical protein
MLIICKKSTVGLIETNSELNARLNSVIEKSNAKNKLLKKILTQLSKDSKGPIINPEIFTRKKRK